jgi:raffinose/stachyose/melibiose transport system substrate-binding protein
MKKIAVITGILLVFGAATVFAGGGRQRARTSGTGAVVLNYPHFAVGTHVLVPSWEAFYKRFTEKYRGKIELVVEELPGDDAYTNKMKVLAASRQLPDVVWGLNGIRDLAIQNGQAVDLRPFLDRDPDYRDNVIGQAALEANTIDGKIYSIASDTTLIGYFYNKDLFQKAGIQPARSWDEWFSNCEKLKAIGVAPLALMTGENSWTTNLILSAMVASRGQAGQTFMNTKRPRTYQTPEMIAALGDIQKCLQKYTTPDALGAFYANAANNFFTEQAAILANGPWMIGDFYDVAKTGPGFDKKVGWSMFPGNGVVLSVVEGYVLCAPPERAEAAWTFIKERTNRESQLDNLLLAGALPLAADLNIPDEVGPLVAAHASAIGKMKYHGDEFDITAYPSVIDAFGRYYPGLASGTLTPADMAAKLDEAAAGAR